MPAAAIQTKHWNAERSHLIVVRRPKRLHVGDDPQLPEARDVIDRYSQRDREMSAAFFVISRMIGLMFWLFLGAVFSTLGGLLGALIFRKTPPPPGVIDIPPQA